MMDSLSITCRYILTYVLVPPKVNLFYFFYDFSATAEIPCDDHRCITGQAALKASTLRRHYYPEGDWGWVIVFVGMLSIILNHGVQISGPLYLLPAGERFKQSAVNSTGEWHI